MRDGPRSAPHGVGLVMAIVKDETQSRGRLCACFKKPNTHFEPPHRCTIVRNSDPHESTAEGFPRSGSMTETRLVHRGDAETGRGANRMSASARPGPAAKASSALGEVRVRTHRQTGPIGAASQIRHQAQHKRLQKRKECGL